jgi:DNA modification methylase
MTADVLLVSADARRIPLADNSVQCVVTSPPYWGLRKYAGEQELIWESGTGIPACALHAWAEETSPKKTGGLNGDESIRGYEENRFLPAVTSGTCRRCGAWRGAYGLEPTVEMYVQHSIEILRELRRVLRKDGVLFWNLGDSYCSGAFSARSYETLTTTEARNERYGENARMPANWRNDANKIGRNGRPTGLKPKDLVLMPARIALAAQSDGWWVRSVIIWAKQNPMPESVTDRPTDSYEHILMLTKRGKYYWDADAVREKAENSHSRGNGDGGRKARARNEEGVHVGWTEATRELVTERNMRNVWMFPTQPYAGAHFATFPEELPRRCILAATSAKGACLQCGSPWRRVTKQHVRFEGGSGKAMQPDSWNGSHFDTGKTAEHQGQRMQLRGGKNGEDYEQAVSGEYDIRMGPVIDSQTIGWSPTCRCRGQHGKTQPCVVLDPFAGSGTTGRVAIELNRRAVLLDLAYGRATAEDRAKCREYARLARTRLSEVQRTLPL